MRLERALVVLGVAWCVAGCGTSGGGQVAPAPAPIGPELSADGSMVRVRAGEFIRGQDQGPDNRRPARRVQLSEFWIDRTEVTVAAYSACVDAGACAAPPTSGWKCGDVYLDWNNWVHRQERAQHPINCVSWSQARAFCAWVGKRLPTEAEWEKAARGDDGRTHAWGEELVFESRTRWGNFWDASSARLVTGEPTIDGYNDGFPLTAPVGSFPHGRSPSGAEDMAGNVWEWVADRYAPDAYAEAPTVDPLGPASGSERVLRGAGFFDADTQTLHITSRGHADPEQGAGDVGFRCARTSSPDI